MSNWVVLVTSGVTEVAEASVTDVETRAWIGGRRMIATREIRVTGTSGTGTQGTILAEANPGATIAAGTDLKTGDVEIEVVAADEAGAGVEGVGGVAVAAVVVAAAPIQTFSRLS